MRIYVKSYYQSQNLMCRTSHCRKIKVKMDNYVRDKEALKIKTYTIKLITYNQIFDDDLILRITLLKFRRSSFIPSTY